MWHLYYVNMVLLQEKANKTSKFWGLEYVPHTKPQWKFWPQFLSYFQFWYSIWAHSGLHYSSKPRSAVQGVSKEANIYICSHFQPNLKKMKNCRTFRKCKFFNFFQIWRLRNTKHTFDSLQFFHLSVNKKWNEKLFRSKVAVWKLSSYKIP